jgi:hypothetical protein
VRNRSRLFDLQLTIFSPLHSVCPIDSLWTTVRTSQLRV